MDYGHYNIFCITLDAKIIVLSDKGQLLKTLSLENVTTIAHIDKLDAELYATTNDGSLFDPLGEIVDEIVGCVRLREVKQPIVAAVSDPYRSFLYLLTSDMKILHYNRYDKKVKTVSNVEDIISITSGLLVRVDGSIYEYFRDFNEEKFEFLPNKTVTNAKMAIYQLHRDGDDYAIITTSDELLYKSIVYTDMDLDQSYDRIITGGAVLTVASDLLLTIIRADGRVLTSSDDEPEPIVTVPRLNVFNYYR